MSRYIVTSFDPCLRVIVGFDRDFGGFFYVAHEEGQVRSVMQSEPDTLITVHDLVTATWGIVDWSREHSTLRKLRDDTWKSQAAISGRDGEVSALLVQAYA